MTNFVIGLIRTYVPIIVGAVVSFLLTLGVELDTATAAAAVIALTGLLQGLYYLAVRLLAEKWPSAGVLLGVNTAPSYDSAP